MTQRPWEFKDTDVIISLEVKFEKLDGVGKEAEVGS